MSIFVFFLDPDHEEELPDLEGTLVLLSYLSYLCCNSSKCHKCNQVPEWSTHYLFKSYFSSHSNIVRIMNATYVELWFLIVDMMFVVLALTDGTAVAQVVDITSKGKWLFIFAFKV